MKKIGFIGAGNMGGALAAAVTKTDNKVSLCCARRENSEAIAARIGAEVATANEIANNCDIIFLGVKPHTLSAVADEIKASLSKRDSICLVSMAAGVTLSRLAEMFGNLPIIRIMPNLAVAIGAGTILWCANAAARERTDAFVESMSAAGTVSAIEESKIDAGSAISGCGPAFAYMFIDAMADGGVACGLTREAALEYASQVLIGAARMVQETGRHPAELKDEVCSPGGSTIAGVLALEDGAFRATVSSAVKASYKKTRELGK